MISTPGFARSIPTGSKRTPGIVPQVVIAEDDPEPHDPFGGCGGCETCCGEWFETEDDLEPDFYLNECGGCEGWRGQEFHDEPASEESHGRKLVEALQTAKHGTTIKIAASCCPSRSGLVVRTSVRLVGTRNHHIRTWNAPLVVRLVYGIHLHKMCFLSCRICIHFSDKFLRGVCAGAIY